MRMKSLALACVSLVFGFSSTASARADDVEVGHRYPDFTLPRIDGRAPVSLSDFRGKRVLLIQFASW